MTTLSELDKIAKPILKKLSKEAMGAWGSKSKYKEIRHLQIDKRGSFGERFFAQVLQKIHTRRFAIEYNDGDQGDWDLKFNGLKFEIKTSSIDTNKKFQNEGIKRSGDYDAILFLGITPNQLYVKFILKKDIPFTSLHDRKKRGTGAGLKWDFRETDMSKVTSLSDIEKEFKKLFKKPYPKGLRRNKVN